MSARFLSLRLCALALFVAASAAAQEHVINLGARGKITLFLLGDWKPTVIDMRGEYEVAFKPLRDSVNASATIKITAPNVDRFDTKSRLKLQVEAECAAYELQSVEGKARAREFAIGTGFGYYCNFTDAALRGKKAPPNEFKVVSAGKIRLAPDVLMEVFIGADSFSEEAYQQLLGAIEGLEYKRR